MGRSAGEVVGGCASGGGIRFRFPLFTRWVSSRGSRTGRRGLMWTAQAEHARSACLSTTGVCPDIPVAYSPTPQRHHASSTFTSTSRRHLDHPATRRSPSIQLFTRTRRHSHTPTGRLRKRSMSACSGGIREVSSEEVGARLVGVASGGDASVRGGAAATASESWREASTDSADSSAKSSTAPGNPDKHRPTPLNAPNRRLVRRLGGPARLA